MDWSIIHPEITAVSEQKFRNGHLADAVESALKQANKRVKEYVKAETGEERDGASLMTHAFSLKRPIIKLDDLDTETGRNIQQGYMQIFAGAMTGIRNPKAHHNIQLERERAVHFLYLASLLMCKLDEAGIPPLTRAEREVVTQAELNEIAAENYNRAHHQLEEVYEKLSARLQPSRRRLLDWGHSVWQVFCDLHAELVASAYEGGTIWPLIYNKEKERLATARISELESLLEDENAT
ncbi:TIGR02391 family protein [Acidobacteria bacterium AH-259-G07]|nr:TIGR02391 family protein [Acidobacteria bacterium AH-259-G07]